MRTNSTQLPTFKELCDILAYEASRPIPEGKKDIHYVDFSTAKALIQSYGLSTEFLDNNIRIEDLKDGKVFEKISELFSGLVENILCTQNEPARQELFNNIYDYLSQSDEPEQADIIFVFGSKMLTRTEKAVQLYKEGFAPKIVLSGRGPFYELDKHEKPEAEILAGYALDKGVPKTALILEKESITIPDNVKRSLNLLERDGVPHKRIILVNSPFSQRRGWAHFSKMGESGTKLIRVNADSTLERYSRNGWYHDETGVKLVAKELFGLKLSEMLNTS